MFNKEQVSSSVVRKLGIDINCNIKVEINIEVVAVFDAAQNYSLPVNEELLFDRHAFLSPTSYCKMYKILYLQNLSLKISKVYLQKQWFYMQDYLCEKFLFVQVLEQENIF